MNDFKKLILTVVVALGVLAACGGTSTGTDGGSGGGTATGGGSATGGGTGTGGGGSSAGCVSTTPVTNLDFLNHCTDPAVEKILKETTWRDAGVTLPPLP